MARKQKMKVYHGIPKSVTDEHTIFYLENDNNIVSNVDRKYNTPVGIGYTNFRGINGCVTTIDSLDQLTIDFWLDSTNYQVGTDSTIISILNQTNDRILIIDQAKGGKGAVWFSVTDGPNQHGQHNISTNDTQGLKHIRCTINGATISIYNNGKLIATKNVFKNWYAGSKKVVLFTASTNSNTMLESYNLKGSVVSDIHISNIDRGDYFPNLPRDFVEGKATIKPRMGQQQIKSDAMYSQTANVKIPAFNAETSKLYYMNSDRSSGYLKSNPEVSEVSRADTWATNSYFKIKGLNGEAISGVIDTDTAVCKGIKYIVEGNNAQLQVDNVSKLQVNDKLKVFNPSLKQFGAEVLTVTAIDVASKIITLSGAVSTYNNYNITVGWNVFIEITESSSAPTVKTQDGAIVAGTWSGLGTNEAKFVLGANSDVQGKDVYVEYSLHIPSGNSDLSELPNVVEKAWGENGVEMKPVNEIVIIDDFKGKIKGSTKECPHTTLMMWEPTLQPLTSFVTQNDTQDIYGALSASDNSPANCSTSTNTKRSQQLFSFNLIEIVERKLGCEIPSKDKAQWLKDNCDSVRVNYTGYGVGPAGPKVNITIFDHSTKKWLDNWLVITTSNPSSKSGGFRVEHFERIIPNGVLSVLAYAEASNGTVASTIRTDYISVEVRLKTDPAFTTLYCSNKRAREDRCNPILIQEETKTIKRYMPSTESFTTECSYINQPQTAGNISGDSVRTKLIEDPYIYVATLGTGFVSSAQEIYRNCLSYIGDSYIKSMLHNLDGKYLETNLSYLRFTRVPCTTSNTNDKYVLPSKYFDGEYICIKPLLTSKSGELILTLSLRHMRNGSSIYHTEREYTLPNRPLIK